MSKSPTRRKKNRRLNRSAADGAVYARDPGKRPAVESVFNLGATAKSDIAAEKETMIAQCFSADLNSPVDQE